MPKNCPYCRTVNAEANSRCECGFDFMKPSQVAAVCPSCGGSTFRMTRPKGFVAFVNDRICKECKTRYTPPTPLWAGILFPLVGLLLAGIGGFSIVVRVEKSDFMGLPAMVFEGFLSLVGLLAIGQGIRSLIRPGKA